MNELAKELLNAAAQVTAGVLSNEGICNALTINIGDKKLSAQESLEEMVEAVLNLSFAITLDLYGKLKDYK